MKRECRLNDNLMYGNNRNDCIDGQEMMLRQTNRTELECFVCRSMSDRTGMISNVPLSSTLGFLKNSSLNNVPSVDNSSRSSLLLIRAFCGRFEMDSLSNASETVLLSALETKTFEM